MALTLNLSIWSTSRNNLAPVLFLLYINDVSENIISQIRLFADDGIIYREINKDQAHVTLQEDLDNLNNWAKKWQLNFNFSKYYHLGITNQRAPETYSYVMNNQIISRVSSTKYLGITINHNLNWNKHCDIICSKTNSTLGLLRRIIDESRERILVLSVHNLSMPAQSGTLTPRGTSTRSSCFNAELQDLSLMTIPELFTSLQ